MNTARRMFAVESLPKAIAHTVEAWEEEFMADHLCPGCNRWRQDVPYAPVDALLRRVPRSLLSTTGLFKVLSQPLAKILEQYGRGLVFGSVRLAPGGDVLPNWRTAYSTRETWLEEQRGRYSRHRQCRVCNTIVYCNGWAHPVIVERYLDDRWVYLNLSADVFVDERLIESESLRDRFPTLRFYPVPVVPEPLDGEVLPGDPGWTGVFTKLPLPKPPDSKPEKGIGLWI
jgi:hypothetical protein